MTTPATVAHADWSSDPRRCWVAVASRLNDGGWIARGPAPLRSARGMIHGLGLVDRRKPVVIGFDFPIGIPRAYARAVGVSSFRVWLKSLGQGDWARFFDVARTADEISVHRPFYPAGTARTGDRARLYAALRLGHDALLRRCDRAHGTRRAAAPIFMTIGAQQVGKAAIAGWRDLLQPAMAEESTQVGIWPFDGEFVDLVMEKEIVVVETYPTELYQRIGVDFGRASKLDQGARGNQASALLSAAERLSVVLDARLASAVARGFGPDDGRDDGFDAVAGLLGMLGVMVSGVPVPRDDEDVLAVEGWMFGQEP